RTVTKGHGRCEIRELWLVPAGDLEPYLAQEWGWVGVRQVGWLRRQQQRRRHGGWADETVTVVVSQAADQASPAVVLQQLRGHWGIETGCIGCAMWWQTKTTTDPVRPGMCWRPCATPPS